MLSLEADYLFVYGTLRRHGGSPWHDLLARHCEFAGEAYFQGRLYMLRGYPGLVCSTDDQDQVLGELYRLPPLKDGEGKGELNGELNGEEKGEQNGDEQGKGQGEQQTDESFEKSAETKSGEAGILTLLDEYEECSENFPAPHEYLRQIHFVTTQQQEQVLAWVYIYNRSTAHLARIDSGDFLAR